MAIKLNHQTTVTSECVLFITRKQKQAFFFSLRYRSYLCHVRHTRFPLGCL